MMTLSSVYTLSFEHKFFSSFAGLFHGYDKLTAAAKRVAPILEDLELRHLSRFNLTWELLNKAVYYQIVYNDESISSKLPEMVTIVSITASLTLFFSPLIFSR